MFAVIKAKGFQYLVGEGEVVTIPAKIGDVGQRIEFDQVLMIKDETQTYFGKPYIKGAMVKGIIKKNGKSDKVIVFKFRRRENYRRKRGHRQDFSEIEITNIIREK
ncbi:50S ribosomal protein L21 [candidate division WOR-3 bacterium RBG_13_43_14]|uniref:Large ribosomal subunit protein bL21 n=1 Tax=candidate division WOR-3 bacterium RBG_13_43_14 TaxID=1802590 RepID=A0A1F4UFI1_UNCW3|nr:MAG: 50S ribosomal protein L21 [candidate division WOR-3 bacterium RBG_13_43_14]